MIFSMRFRLRQSGQRKRWVVLAAVVITILIGGCGRPAVRHESKPQTPAIAGKTLPRLGYTIQAGAFANVENAERLTRSLKEKGLDSTYFVARQGLFKVRLGNFRTREQARARAEDLKRDGVIEEFYIVSPEEYSVAKREARGEAYLRDELVRTARSFIGIPYLWGGASVETGFDCSGLTMTVYQLNGLDLPRNSREQFGTGNAVDRSDLEKGDLIFFATKERDRVSHVGIYIGDGQFIHAPGRGKDIRTDFLAREFYVRSYMGARSYM
jgi:hypothetical protein